MAPPGSFTVVPSTNTLVKLKLPPFRNSEVTPPSRPVRPRLKPGKLSSSGASETLWRCSISSRVTTLTGAVMASTAAGSACAETTTVAASRSSSSRMRSSRVSPTVKARSSSTRANDGWVMRTRYLPGARDSVKRPSSPLVARCRFPGAGRRSAETAARAMAAPLGSVNVPVRVVVDCARAQRWPDRTALKMSPKTTENRKPIRMTFPPLPLARELKVVPRSSEGKPKPSRAADSAGLLAWRHI